MKLFSIALPLFFVFFGAFGLHTYDKATQQGKVEITKERFIEALKPITTANHNRYN
jgi:uncharacterized membrane protein YgdD (TMEM256/DUF423 family)